VTKTKLIISTNSRERADALKERVSAALQEIATHRGRTEQALPTMRGGRDLMIDSQSVSTTSTAEVYRGWLDTEIPLLDGRTPRAAISDPAAVPTIHLMLKEMENMAARSPNPAGYDSKQFRRELGLDEYGGRVSDHDLDRALGHGRKIAGMGSGAGREDAGRAQHEGIPREAVEGLRLSRRGEARPVLRRSANGGEVAAQAVEGPRRRGDAGAAAARVDRARDGRGLKP
jgi:hypothetical protein